MKQKLKTKKKEKYPYETLEEVAKETAKMIKDLAEEVISKG